MSIENIEKTILGSARAEAEKLVAEATAEAEAALAAAKAESEERKESAQAETQAALEQERHQQETAAKAANKLRLLTHKAEILDEIFQAAVTRFIGDRSGGYSEWLVAQLRSVASERGEIVAAKPDRNAIAALLADRAAADGLALADDSLPAQGGFLLRGEKVDLDLTLDTRLDAIRETLLPELAGRAFPPATERAEDGE